jgi:hypothetical protein
MVLDLSWVTLEDKFRTEDGKLMDEMFRSLLGKMVCVGFFCFVLGFLCVVLGITLMALH